MRRTTSASAASPIRNYPHPNFEMAVSLAQLGRLDEAHSAVKAGLALNPAFAIFRARALGMAIERRSDIPGPA